MERVSRSRYPSKIGKLNVIRKVKKMGNRRYPECQREDGNCDVCSLQNYYHDCRDNPVNQLAYLRTMRGISQQALANASNVNIRQIQRVEAGDSEIGNLTLKNAIALADALGVDAKELLK